MTPCVISFLVYQGNMPPNFIKINQLIKIWRLKMCIKMSGEKRILCDIFGAFVSSSKYF